MIGEQNVSYIEGGRELLDRTKPLWKILNEIHLNCSTEFRAYYGRMTFEAKKESLLEKVRDGLIYVILAYDENAHSDVGYCISTLTRDGLGEIESIFVIKEFRGRNIGDQLLKKSLKWLESKRSRNIKIAVASGNEATLSFYVRYGFKPRVTVLERPPR